MTLPQDADFEGAFLLSGPQTGGIRDMVLMYNGPYKDYGGNPGYGNWSKADCKPYAAYVDESGRAQDVMFDSALFLAQSSPETGHLFIESPATWPTGRTTFPRPSTAAATWTRWMPLWQKQPPSWGVRGLK